MNELQFHNDPDMVLHLGRLKSRLAEALKEYDITLHEAEKLEVLKLLKIRIEALKRQIESANEAVKKATPLN